MQKRFYLWILLFFLAGCGRPAALPPATEPRAVAQSTLAQSSTKLPTPASSSYVPPPTRPTSRPVTSTPTPVPTPSPVPPPTPTYPPYTDNPFTVLFVRDGNLWLAEVGGSGERQLTSELPGWTVSSYSVAPDCWRVAYSSYRNDSGRIDGLVKQVDLADGTVSVLIGEDNAYSEGDVRWLDATHVAFEVSEFLVAGHEKDLPPWGAVQPFHSIVMDLDSGETTLVPESLELSQSPDGRYWLTGSCYYVYECPLDYMLRDRQSGETWPVAAEIGWGRFLGWSPDSRQMLFSGLDNPDSQKLWLVLVDVASREEIRIAPSDKLLFGGGWSPDGESISYEQCAGREDPSGRPMDCALGLMDRNGGNQQVIAPLPSDSVLLPHGWTPDGRRLILYDPNAYQLWSIRRDGTDLRPIVFDADSVHVLCEP